MTEDISIDNLKLIYNLKQYYSKVLLSLTDEEKEMFIKILERLKYAQWFVHKYITKMVTLTLTMWEVYDHGKKENFWRRRKRIWK